MNSSLLLEASELERSVNTFHNQLCLELNLVWDLQEPNAALAALNPLEEQG